MSAHPTRTEAQIKAEALREAAREVIGVFTRSTGNNPRPDHA